MRTTMHKWFWIWDFDKEEQWLNQMAANGKALVHTGFCTYELEDCTPGEYIYRLELLENLPGTMESQQYIRFLEETGAEQIGSYLRWCYFRRKASLGAFDLFSDFDSRIQHLNRMLWILYAVLPLNLFSGILNVWGYWGRTPNVVGGICNLIVALLLILGIIRITAKKTHLKREREITEN